MGKIFNRITYNYTHIIIILHLPHHISALSINVSLNALWNHPPDGHLLLTPLLTVPAVVVRAIQILCQPKVSHFDQSMLINPALKTSFHNTSQIS